MSEKDGTVTSIVIRLVDQGERNRIVTLLTAEADRVSAISRGARGKSRRFGGHLDLFHQGEAVITRRHRSGLGTLQRFDVREPYEGIRQDIVKFAVASYLVELVSLTTVEEAADASQYQSVSEMLTQLAQMDQADPRNVLLGFQLRWFYLLGMLPELTPAGLASAQMRPISPEALEAAHRLLLGVPETMSLQPSWLKDIGLLTRTLRFRVLSRPLASEPFLRQVLRDLLPSID